MEPDANCHVAVASTQCCDRCSAALPPRGFSSAPRKKDHSPDVATSFSLVVMVDLQLPSPHGGSLFDTMRELTDSYVSACTPRDDDNIRFVPCAPGRRVVSTR